MRRREQFQIRELFWKSYLKIRNELTLSESKYRILKCLSKHKNMFMYLNIKIIFIQENVTQRTFSKKVCFHLLKSKEPLKRVLED